MNYHEVIMRQAPVLENNSKELRLYVTNIRPHNMIFFKDNIQNNNLIEI